MGETLRMTSKNDMEFTGRLMGIRSLNFNKTILHVEIILLIVLSLAALDWDKSASRKVFKTKPGNCFITL